MKLRNNADGVLGFNYAMAIHNLIENGNPFLKKSKKMDPMELLLIEEGKEINETDKIRSGSMTIKSLKDSFVTMFQELGYDNIGPIKTAQYIKQIHAIKAHDFVEAEKKISAIMASARRESSKVQETEDYQCRFKKNGDDSWDKETKDAWLMDMLN